MTDRMCIVCHVALPQPPADFFNLGAVNTTSEGPPSSLSESHKSQAASGQPAPPGTVSSPATGPGYGMPPMPMFRPPIGMMPPPHLALGPGGPRRPPPPPPRMHGPMPGRPFPPGVYLLPVFQLVFLLMFYHCVSCIHVLVLYCYSSEW